MGVTASIVKVPDHVRYCPGCLREQRNAVGEYFWQREWQVAGVECCERHGELLNAAFTRPLIDRHRYHAASPETCPLFPQKLVNVESARILDKSDSCCCKGRQFLRALSSGLSITIGWLNGMAVSVGSPRLTTALSLKPCQPSGLQNFCGGMDWE